MSLLRAWEYPEPADPEQRRTRVGPTPSLTHKNIIYVEML